MPDDEEGVSDPQRPDLSELEHLTLDGQEREEPTLSSLSQDVFVHIVRFLALSDMGTAAQVCADFTLAQRSRLNAEQTLDLTGSYLVCPELWTHTAGGLRVPHAFSNALIYPKRASLQARGWTGCRS